MAMLNYVNMSNANMTAILGDYNTKFNSYFSIWLFLLMILLVIVYNQLARLTFAPAFTISTFCVAFLSVILSFIGIVTWGEVTIFVALFAISLFVMLVNK